MPPAVWRKSWAVNVQAFGSGTKAIKYLGAYVGRSAAIRNSDMNATTKHRLNQAPAAAKIIPSRGHAPTWPNLGKHARKTGRPSEQPTQTPTTATSATPPPPKRTHPANETTPSANIPPTQNA